VSSVKCAMTRTGRSRLEHRNGWLNAVMVMVLAYDRPLAPESLVLAKFSL